jgi:hypothetical protein
MSEIEERFGVTADGHWILQAVPKAEKLHQVEAAELRAIEAMRED